VRDQDTIRRFDLLELSTDDYWSILKGGCLVALLALVEVAILVAGTDTETWAAVWLPPLAGVVYAIWMLWHAKRRLTPAQRRRLHWQRGLLRKGECLQAARGEVNVDRTDLLAQMAQLRDQITRMIRLDADQLADEIAALKELYKCLDDRERIDRELLGLYDHECQVLVAEADALDIFPEAAQEALATRLAELAELKEVIASSVRHRDAERELDRLLGEATG